MSERKVSSKYYPPDFDPSKLTRSKGPKPTGPKLQPVRLMAPFSMKCTSCSEYIYRGRKFNARKEITEERYLSRPIIRFYIRCTRCSAEITFKTDPKNTDFTCERGAKRNFEPWREAKLAEETEEERLDRLQEEEDNRDAMAELEQKTFDAKTEMAVADALDEIRTRNAAREVTGGREGALVGVETPLGEKERAEQEERERLEREDAEAARRAFALGEGGERVRRIAEDEMESPAGLMLPPPLPAAASSAASAAAAPSASSGASFQRTVKKKKNHAAALGLKAKKVSTG